MPNVKVQTLDGRRIHVEIASDDTFESVKYKVADTLGIDPHMQKLICNNIEVKNNDKVVDMMELFVKCDGVLHLVLKNSIHEEDYHYPPDGSPKRRFSSGKNKEKGSKLFPRFGCRII